MAKTTYNIREKLNTPSEEAYKILRSNIQFCSSDRKIRSIAICSYGSGEGKTTVAINLSISLARAGMKVLFVDADMRKPMIVKHLGSNNSSGLSNLLSGFASFDDIICNTNIDNFNLIACGPKSPNPAELIASERFGRFLEEAHNKYDMVIIDTPPLGGVIDCAVIAAQTDGVLMVIESKAVDYRCALSVKEQLDKANARILGVVLNKVDRLYYKNYYSCYGYYRANRINKKWVRKNMQVEKVKV